MIRALLIILLLFVSVWLGIQLSQDPGYLLIAINHWTVETTLWVAIAALVLMFVFMHVIWDLVKWMVRIPTSWHKWQARRRAQKAQANTRQGLIEFSEGYWSQAKKHLIKALPDTDTPLINYLIAARAAQEMGDSQLRDDYLREAQQSMPEAKIAVELTQAQLQLANRQWEQALATLKHLQTLAPQHPYVLKLLMNLYQEVRDWSHLIDLLPELKKNQVISGDEFKRLQQYTYLQSMTDLIKQEQYQSLNDFMENIPMSLRNNPELVAKYAQYLLNHAHDQEAENLLRKCLKKHHNEELISLYGLIKGEVVQLNFAESLLKAHPHSAILLFTLGRICKSKKLWGKARQYLEESIALTPTPQAYKELGTLLEQINDEAGAFMAYRRGLLLAEKSGTQKTEPL